MSFLTPLVLRVNDDDDGFVLDRELAYLGARERFEIPAGTPTDLGTRPRATSYLFDTYGRGTTRPFVLHDLLCRSETVSRRDADGIMERALLEQGVSELRASLLWAAVRLGGRLEGVTSAERLRLLRLLPHATLLLALTPLVWFWQVLFRALEG